MADLAALRKVAEAMGAPAGSIWAAIQAAQLSTPAKLYAESVLMGKKGPITEADFTPEELAAMQQLTGAREQGSVDYPAYGGAGPGMMGLMSPKGRVANTLGQFSYEKDPAGTTITDAYDFNPIYKNESVLTNLAQALGTAGFAPLHLLGEHLLPPGSGRQVKVRLPR